MSAQASILPKEVPKKKEPIKTRIDKLVWNEKIFGEEFSPEEKKKWWSEKGPFVIGKINNEKLSNKIDIYGEQFDLSIVVNDPEPEDDKKKKKKDEKEKKTPSQQGSPPAPPGGGGGLGAPPSLAAAAMPQPPAVPSLAAAMPQPPAVPSLAAAAMPEPPQTLPLTATSMPQPPAAPPAPAAPAPAPSASQKEKLALPLQAGGKRTKDAFEDPDSSTNAPKHYKFEDKPDEVSTMKDFERLYLGWLKDDAKEKEKEKEKENKNKNKNKKVSGDDAVIIKNVMRNIFRYVFGDKKVKDVSQFHQLLRIAYSNLSPEEKIPCPTSLDNIWEDFRHSIEYRRESAIVELQALYQIQGNRTLSIEVIKKKKLLVGLTNILNLLDQQEKKCIVYGNVPYGQMDQEAFLSSSPDVKVLDDSFIRMLKIMHMLVKGRKDKNKDLFPDVAALEEAYKQQGKPNETAKHLFKQLNLLLQWNYDEKDIKELQKKAEDADILEEKRNRLLEEINRLKAQIKALEIRIEKRDGVIAELEDQLAALRRQLQASQRELQTVNEELEIIREAAQRTFEQQAQLILDQQQEIAYLKQNVRELIQTTFNLITLLRQEVRLNMLERGTVQQTLGELQRRLAECEAANAALQAENEGLQAQNLELQAQIQALQAQGNQLQEQVQALQEENAELQAQNEARIAENTNLAQQLAECREQLLALQAQIQSLLEKRDIDRELLVEKDATIEDLRQQGQAKDARIAQLEAELADLRAQLAGLQAELAALREQQEASQASLGEAQGSLAASNAELDRLRRELERANKTIADLEERIAELEALLQAAGRGQAAAEARAAAAETEAAAQAARAAAAEAEAARAVASEEEAAARAAAAEAAAQAAQVAGQQAAAGQAQAEARAAAAEAKAAAAEAAKKKAEAQAAAQTARAEAAAAQAAAQAARAQVAEAGKRDAEAAKKRAEDSAAASAAEAAQQEARAAQAEAELADLRRQLAEEKAKVVSLTAQIAKKEREKAELEGEIEGCEEELARLRAEIEGLRAQIAELERQLRECRAALAQATIEKEAAERRAEEAEARIEELRRAQPPPAEPEPEPAAPPPPPKPVEDAKSLRDRIRKMMEKDKLTAKDVEELIKLFQLKYPGTGEDQGLILLTNFIIDLSKINFNMTNPSFIRIKESNLDKIKSRWSYKAGYMYDIGRVEEIIKFILSDPVYINYIYKRLYHSLGQSPKLYSEKVKEYLPPLDEEQFERLGKMLDNTRSGREFYYWNQIGGGKKEEKEKEQEEDLCTTAMILLLLELKSNNEFEPETFLEKIGQTIDDLGQCPIVLHTLNELLDKSFPVLHNKSNTDSIYYSPLEIENEAPLRSLLNSYEARFTDSEKKMLENVAFPVRYYSKVPEEFQGVLGESSYLLHGNPKVSEETMLEGVDDEIYVTQEERKLLEKEGIPLGAILAMWLVGMQEMKEDDSTSRCLKPKRKEKVKTPRRKLMGKE